MNTFPLLETEPLSLEANHRIFTALAREMTLDAPAVEGGGTLVEDATISYLQLDEPAGRNRRPWLLALVAVAAGVLGVGIMVRDNSARTRTNGDVTPETMPIYLPTVLPDGFTFSNGNDYTNRNSPPLRDQVYRDPSKPIGARAVQITTSLASAWGDRSLGHPILIRGRPAFDTSRGDLFGVQLTDGAISISVSGRGVSFAEIERIVESARAVSTNPADGANVSFLPDGLKLVIDQGTMPPNRNIDVSYSRADGVHQLDVHIWPTLVMPLEELALTGGSAPTTATIRGHDALRFVDATQDSVGFAWSETKDVLVSVTGTGLSIHQVRQAAESMRRVSSKEWANMLKSKDIPIQDDGAPGSPVAVATTAATNVSDRTADPWSVPLLVPEDGTDIGHLRSARDTTVQAPFDGSLRLSQRQVFRATSTALGLRAVQVEWSYAKFTTANAAVGPIEGQAPFTEPIPPEILQSKAIDPNGVFFRVSGRGVTQDELRTVARSVTAPGTVSRTASWIDVGSLPDGFVLAESRETAYEQYRSTTLNYGSVSVAMNPLGSGGIESYAIATPGSFAAINVRGHDGYIVADPATDALRLVWVDSPGLLVEVKGIGTDDATLERLAESLQPVSTDAWKKLLATVNAKPETVKAP